MKRPTFLEGVVVAFVASLFGSALFGVVATVVPGSVTLRALVAGLGLVYILYLLARSHNPVGRITSLVVWGAVTAATWLLEPPLALYVVLHAGLIWLIRSLYFYLSAISALADMGLSLLGLVVAVWAATETGSPFLSIWSFFLVQALFAAIPVRMGGNPHEPQPEEHHDERFERAHRAAQAALRRLSSVRYT